MQIISALHLLVPFHNEKFSIQHHPNHKGATLRTVLKTTKFNYHILVAMTVIQSELVSVNIRATCQTQ